MQSRSTTIWPTRWDYLVLAGFITYLVGFGALVEVRSAFLSRHMGDLGVYLRASWAVRTGEDIYTVTDNEWHYCYPPLLAILMTPLADPPPGADATGMVPYAASVAIWYVLSVLCLLLAVHWLASALEATATDPDVRNQPRGCRRWWLLRMLPMLVCLVPIGHTLMRGQVNLLVLALLCASAAAVVRGQRFRAGLWLAGPMCIKIFPAFLLLYPLWRRDLRCLAGCALGLAIGLVAIPAAVFGPAQTVDYYRELTEVLVRPALGAGEDQSRSKELIDVTATDSQSLLATMHNTMHLDRATRPHQASSAVRTASMAIGGLLTLLALFAAGWRTRQEGPRAVVFFGALVLNMLLLCPVCHLHYFCMALPLVVGLMARRWEACGTMGLGLGLVLIFLANVLAGAPEQLPGLEVLRDCGLAMYGALLLWGAGIVALWRGTGRRVVAAKGVSQSLPLAA